MNGFRPHASEIKYVQDDRIDCVLISQASALFYANEHVVEHAVLSQILSSLSCDTVGYLNRI